jgi:glucose/arabinose dehydrogenase
MNRRHAAVLLAVAVTVAACSDDDTGSPVESSPNVTFNTAAPSPTDVADTTAPGTEPPDTTAETPPDTTTPLAPESVVLTPYASGLSQPVDLAIRPGDDAFYVVEQTGTISQLSDGAVVNTVLDIAGSISTGNEQGLLGLAFHPTEALAYVNYTRGNGDTVIEEYVVGDDGVFDPATAREVLVVEQPYSNHNGGDLTFGPDGFLYIGTGDGGSANDPERRSLNVSQLLGKMLRIDPVASGGQPYTAPADNPFVGVTDARPEVWSVGLRNPWRFNFDSETGDLWIADVGQNQWEEVNVVTAAQGGGRGVNFGWSAFEGAHRFNDDQASDGVTPPVFEYAHGDDPGGCSVSGGDVYRGTSIPSLVGWYVFSDFCSGRITALQADGGVLTGQVELGQVSSVSAVSIGPDGEMYILSLGEGTITRVDPA